MEVIDLVLPPFELSTHGFWVDLPRGTKAAVEEAGILFRDAMHAAQHVFVNCLPLFVRCDRADIETEHASIDQIRDRPGRFIVYEGSPGGLGQ